MDEDAFIRVLKEGLQELSIGVQDRIIEDFVTYKQELLEWNRKIDLTTITRPEEIAVKHFIDSLIPSKFIKEGAFVMDIGSGAGFPGIPLKILRQDLKVLLLEATQKKYTFLKHIIRLLQLNGITAVNQRAEEPGFRSVMKGTIDVVISRAFARIVDFFDIARHYVKETGAIIGMLGKEWKAAIDEVEPVLKLNGFILSKKEEYYLPFQMGTRVIAVIEKK